MTDLFASFHLPAWATRIHTNLEESCPLYTQAFAIFEQAPIAVLAAVAFSLLVICILLLWQCLNPLFYQWRLSRRLQARRLEYLADLEAKEAKRVRVSAQVQQLLINEIKERGLLPEGVHISSAPTSSDYSNLGYVPDAQVHGECLAQFMPVKSQTHCTFAKESKLVYPFNWDRQRSFDENILRNIPLLLEATVTGPANLIDGIVFYAPGEYGSTVERLGDTMNRVLWLLNGYDPTRADIMSQDGMDRRGWRWSFNGTNMFITSFGSCYHTSNPRFAFGSDEFCFLLFQPESSFGRHEIGDYHSPIRTRIRTNFERNNRQFWCPGSPRYYPFIWNFVGPHRPLDPLVLKRGPPDQWWKRKPEITVFPREDFSLLK